MNFLDQLLGFAVLTSPLWLLLILVPVAFWIQIKAAKRFERRRTKIMIGALAFMFVLVAPFIDEIAGRIYLRQLCSREAGIRIHKTIELPAYHWDEHGNPKFFNQYGHLDRDLWLKALDRNDHQVEQYSSLFSIEKDTSIIRERATRDIAAEVVTFRFWGGWIRKNLSPHNTANSCEFIHDPAFGRRLYSQLFRPPTASR